MPKIRDWEDLDDEAGDYRFEKIHRHSNHREDLDKVQGNKKQNKPKRIPKPDILDEPEEL